MRINETALKYKLYESALETGNEDIYYQIIEEGILGDLLDKVKGLFSKEDQAEVEKASSEIEKPLAKIVEKLKTAGKKPDEIKAFVGNVVEKILKSAKGEEGKAGATTGGAPSGTPVAADSEQAKGAMAAAAAQAAGQDPKKAVEKAADLSGDKVYSALVNSFAKQTKVPVEKVKAILDYITKNKLLTTEGRLVSVYDLRRVLGEHESERRSLVILERWQQLAGVNESLLLEKGFADLVKNLPKLDPKKIQGIIGNAKFQEKLKKLGPAKAEFEKLLKQVGAEGDFSKLADAGKKQIADFLKGKLDKLGEEPAGTATAGKEEGGKEGDGPKVSAEAEKKFKDLAGKLVGRLKGVKEREIIAVLDALDGSNLEVKTS